jgi:hypothetical protein
MIEKIESCKEFIGNYSAPLAIAYALHKKSYGIVTGDVGDNVRQSNLYTVPTSRIV